MSALTQGSRVKVRHLVRDAHGRWSTIWKYGAIVGFGLHTDPVMSIRKSTYVRVQMDEGDTLCAVRRDVRPQKLRIKKTER